MPLLLFFFLFLLLLIRSKLTNILESRFNPYGISIFFSLVLLMFVFVCLVGLSITFPFLFDDWAAAPLSRLVTLILLLFKYNLISE